MSHKKLNIALVTNKSYHHKYWIVEMMNQLNVKCIIHPNPTSSQGKYSFLKTTIKDKGFWYVILIFLTKLYYIFVSENLRSEFRSESKKWFSKSLLDYDNIDKQRIFNVNSVNSERAIKIIKDNDIDVICFLGGDIAKSDFINASKIISLNYHSGVSPIYNGTGSYAWAVAEGRPNLVGGTLMEITEKIDYGNIISQFLPSIEENDTASSLFMKTIIGSVELISNVIEKLVTGEEIKMVRQERSIRYTKSIDWTLYQEIQLQSFYKSKKITKYIRESSVIVTSENKNNSPFIPETFVKTLKTQSV